MTQPIRKADRISKAFDKFLNLLGYLSGIIVVLLMLFVSYEVVMRYFFNYPTIWVIDMSGLLMLAVTFLGTAWVLRIGGHTSLDMILLRFSLKTQAIINGITSLVALVACAVFLVQSVAESIDALRNHEFLYLTFEAPRHIPLWFITFGFLTLCIQFMRRTWGYFTGFHHMRSVDDDSIAPN